MLLKEPRRFSEAVERLLRPPHPGWLCGRGSEKDPAIRRECRVDPLASCVIVVREQRNERPCADARGRSRKGIQAIVEVLHMARDDPGFDLFGRLFAMQKPSAVDHDGPRNILLEFGLIRIALHVEVLQRRVLAIHGHTDFTFWKFNACVLVVPGWSAQADHADTSRVQLFLLQDMLLLGIASTLRDPRRASSLP
eukprot:5059143-Heterocapsa_arctica.AAC.1